jgi:putative protease
MIEHIPELMESAISAFKIEGRMRDSRYIEVVARCYHDAIESYNDGTYTPEKISNWFTELKSVYNRGFSTGFYFHRPNANDVNQQSSGNQATTKRVQIGQITAYYRNIKAAKMELRIGQLKVGDIIYIEGSSTGTFVKQKLTSIQIKKMVVTETPIISGKDSLIVGFIVDNVVKPGDWVYKYENTQDIA